MTFHWYDGAPPPLTGVAVKTARVPAHTGLSNGAIDILTGNGCVIAMVTVFDVAGFPEIHNAFEVK